MTTVMEKKMIAAFYKLTEEKASWEKRQIEANQRYLDLQQICDDQAAEIEKMKAMQESE